MSQSPKSSSSLSGNWRCLYVDNRVTYHHTRAVLYYRSVTDAVSLDRLRGQDTERLAGVLSWNDDQRWLTSISGEILWDSDNHWSSWGRKDTNVLIGKSLGLLETYRSDGIVHFVLWEYMVLHTWHIPSSLDNSEDIHVKYTLIRSYGITRRREGSYECMVLLEGEKEVIYI